MMKRKQLLAGNIIGILLILFVIIAGEISISAVVKSFSKIITSPADIGIIGGAEGPTSIFVSGGFNINTVLFAFLAALLLIAVILVLNVLYLRTGRK